jgi:hypothetical protein
MTSNGAHFHIKWSTKDSLHWECFETFRNASIRANELAAPSEEFTIHMVSTVCPMRGFKSALRESKSAGNEESPE